MPRPFNHEVIIQGQRKNIHCVCACEMPCLQIQKKPSISKQRKASVVEQKKKSLVRESNPGRAHQKRACSPPTPTRLVRVVESFFDAFNLHNSAAGHRRARKKCLIVCGGSAGSGAQQRAPQKNNDCRKRCGKQTAEPFGNRVECVERTADH